MSQQILVLGGTGLLGHRVAQRLQHEGFRVRILVRNLEKARGMFDGSVEIIAGDASNADDVAQALDGCYGVHISLSESVQWAAAQHILAARTNHLQRITYVSGASVAEPHRWFPMADEKLRTEEAIRASGVPYTLFCPTWFYEMALNFIQGNRAIIIGNLKVAYHWLAADDFADRVAKSYCTDFAACKRFVVLGPEAYTIRDLLERVCARLYPHITSVSSIPIWAARLIGTLRREAPLIEASRLMGYFDKIGVETLGDPAEANALLGAPSTTLARWLDLQAAHRAAHRQSSCKS